MHPYGDGTRVSASAKPTLAGLSSSPGKHVEPVDARMLVLMRCLLAFTALALLWLEEVDPGEFTRVTYGSLTLYCLHSAVVALVSYQSGWPAPSRALHWIDIVFFTSLVSLTEGANSLFFYFFFYPILIASLAWGFREGIAVTTASIVLFFALGLYFAPDKELFALHRTLARVAYLFAFGYLIASLGGYEIKLKRRLRLLKDVNDVADARFGFDEVVGRNLDRLLDFYAADSSLLVLKHPGDPPRFVLYQASRRKPGQGSIANAITESAARALLALPETIGASYRGRWASWLPRIRRHVAIDLARQVKSQAFLSESEALANLLDARALLTVPYARPGSTRGRLFVASARHGFPPIEIEFLAQVLDAMAAVLENIVLTEQHFGKAASDERAAIARDLHDTTIQPYIGLKLALEALQREAGEREPISRRIGELVEMAGMTVQDLRKYTRQIRERTQMPGEALAAAVQMHSERLTRFYGIVVDVACDVSAQIDGQLATEAFQMVSEGISNVLRHTAAKSAFVVLREEPSTLLIQIGNAAPEPSDAAPTFMPRSIHERSLALGGTTAVGRRADGYTLVEVRLPLK